MKIEEKLAPRTLSQEQQDSLLSKLTPFAGTAINIRVYPEGTADTLLLSGQIASVLVGAKWQVALSKILSSAIYVRGIVVAINNPTASDAARQLVEGLNSEGISASISDTIPAGDVLTSGSTIAADKVALTMLIGTKQ